MSYLCRQQARPSSTKTSFLDDAIDVLWRNFVSPEFGTSARGKYPNFWLYPNILTTQCRIASMPKQLHSSTRFDTIPACDRRTEGRKDRQAYDDSIYIASIASRSENKSEYSINEVTVRRARLVLRCVTVSILSWYVTSHFGKLTLLPPGRYRNWTLDDWWTKSLGYCRGTERRAITVEILGAATQLYENRVSGSLR